jgi:hypothetical protein
MTTHAQPSSRSPALQAIWRDIPPAAAYAIAAMLGLAMFLELYPISFLLGHGAFFETSDPAQHVTGWRYYTQDGWHFPLLHTARLNHPAGVNIAFTDSIPLAALLFKPFVAWLPAGFHYFGLWHAFAYVTQALAATFLLRGLGVRHLPGLIAAVFLTLVWPALIWRMPHSSLLTHGVILAALGCYVRGRDTQWRHVSATAGIGGIALLALMIHPYLFAMSYALFLMYLAEMALGTAGRREWRLSLAMIAISLAAVFAIAWTLGYLGQGSTSDGFGEFSMNLAAPFCYGSLYPCSPIAPGSGQGEGFNYLGAGVLALIAVAALTRFREIGRLLRRYPVLAAGMAAFALYALSNKVMWHGDVVFSYRIPHVLDKLVNTFRASGRFFWPVGYGLLFLALAALLRRPALWALPVLAVALPLQWIDVKPHREAVRHIASTPSRNDLAPWRAVMAGVTHINVYPAYGCDRTSEKIYGHFQRLGAEYGVTLDTGHIARAMPDCGASQDRFAVPFSDDGLYVMAAAKLDHPFGVPAGFRTALQAGQCGQLGEAVVCRTAATPAAWGGALGLTPVRPQLPARSHWSGAALPTIVGKLEGTTLVATTPGYLSFGPYVPMVPGRYRVRIHYRGDAPRDTVQGKWDAQHTDMRDVVFEAASGPLAGTASEAATIDGIITVPRGAAGVWEVRTQLLGTGRLELIGIDIEKE